MKHEDVAQSVITASLAWMAAWGVIWEGDESQSEHDALNNASKDLYDAVCNYQRASPPPLEKGGDDAEN